MDQLFQPDGIAIVGASSNPAKAGYVAIRNMKEKAYPGNVFPINTRETEILGYPCYASISDVKGNIDLLVLIMPSKMIYSVMDDLDKRMETRGDVKFLVCAAADYAETKTPEGIDRQERLMQTARRFGIRVIGPNCIGVIETVAVLIRPLSTQACRSLPLASQAVSHFSPERSLGLHGPHGRCEPRCAGVVQQVYLNRDMADVTFVDLLDYFETDDSTRVIGIYMEGFSDGKRLAAALRRVSLKKPVVVLKVGQSELGANAANSHTGSMAGSDSVYDAMFKQNGVIRVGTINELIDTLQAFDRMPLPAGGNLFLYSQAGGPGIYCTDAISRYPQLTMPVVSDETKIRLTESQMPMANICHPEGYADITASATVRNHVDGLKIVLEDQNVDAAIFITVVPTFLPQLELAEELVKFEKNYNQPGKPVYYCIMAGAYTTPARSILEKNGLCTFDSPERAVMAAKNMCIYTAFRARHKEEI